MIEWSDFSRRNTLRNYNLNKNKLTVKCYHSHSYSISYDKNENITSLDPDGGPLFYVGRDINVSNNISNNKNINKLTIHHIASHCKNKSGCVFVFDVSIDYNI